MSDYRFVGRGGTLEFELMLAPTPSTAFDNGIVSAKATPVKLD